MIIESEPRSASEVYARHATELVAFATVLVGRSDAQDVVSGAVLRSLESRRWDQIRNHRAYLYRAVANEARNLVRSNSRRRTREVRSSDPAVVHPPEAYPEVQAAIKDLSVRQRAVVYLFYWEDMAEPVIAEHLGIGAGSVRRHLARARGNLRRALDVE